MLSPQKPSPNTILFVDDEAKACKYFALLFGRNHRVLTAADGVEALETFAQHRDEIGLVVTDHIMPRMTGLEFLENLRAGNNRVVRILSTAFTESDMVRSAVAGGLIDYFIGKPWDIEKFQSIMHQSFALLGERLKVDEAC